MTHDVKKYRTFINPVVIPAKAGTQEILETKKLFSARQVKLKGCISSKCVVCPGFLLSQE